jgi:hypothetical protein
MLGCARPGRRPDARVRAASERLRHGRMIKGLAELIEEAAMVRRRKSAG